MFVVAMMIIKHNSWLTVKGYGYIMFAKYREDCYVYYQTLFGGP